MTKRTNYQIATKLRETLADYKKECGINGYTEQTVLDDLLYFVGTAISDEYQFAQGFDRFKQRLREHLADCSPDKTQV